MSDRQPAKTINNKIDEEHNAPIFSGSVLALAFISIFLGGVIYLLWRPVTIKIFYWLELFGLGTMITYIRVCCEPVYHYIPKWIIYSLPNGLWSFSYALIIAHLWIGRNSIMKYFWLTSIPIVGLGYEMLQYFQVIPGTFCIIDLLLCVFGILLGSYIAYSIKRCDGGIFTKVGVSK